MTYHLIQGGNNMNPIVLGVLAIIAFTVLIIILYADSDSDNDDHTIF